jgi:hypothetical protein
VINYLTLSHFSIDVNISLFILFSQYLNKFNGMFSSQDLILFTFIKITQRLQKQKQKYNYAACAIENTQGVNKQ